MVENSYEEARRQRLEENKRRFEELGIAKISQGLANAHNKSQQRVSNSKPKAKTSYALEPRRSSRARNLVPSYRDDVDIDLPSLRKRSRSTSSSWASYIARPLDEIKTASYEDRVRALKVAEELQNSLQSGNPSFVKSMVRSHVYSCFWLGLPSKFCEDYLSKTQVDMVLEDENGAKFDAVYIGKRAGLSGGWRAFALHHKLDDGDALVFELVDPARFKIFIIRAALISSSQEHEAPNCVTVKKKTRLKMKLESESKQRQVVSKEKNDLQNALNGETKSKKKKHKSTDATNSNKEEVPKAGRKLRRRM
ncbi:hypothetical protein SLA2020_521140 [Shorea laevis]